MSETTPVRRPPPLSPYMNWRWHVTMFTSIAHRATGVALYGGALVLAGWALSLASSRTAYATYMDLLNSIPGKLVLFGLTVSVFYHLANGVRHLVWDAGQGFAVKTANLTAWIVVGFSIVASIAFWAVALTMGPF